MDISINNTFSGPFEHVGFEDGAAAFESVQKAASADTTRLYLADLGIQPSIQGQNVLDVNTVKWRVDESGKLSGTARFLASNTHDLIKATLSGESPAPPDGQNYRLANVNVTFDGGTGSYARATGKAQVVAKLFSDGLSVGHIVGTLSVP
jgi:hypothetical protein